MSIVLSRVHDTVGLGEKCPFFACSIFPLDKIVYMCILSIALPAWLARTLQSPPHLGQKVVNSCANNVNNVNNENYEAGNLGDLAPSVGKGPPKQIRRNAHSLTNSQTRTIGGSGRRLAFPPVFLPTSLG